MSSAAFSVTCIIVAYLNLDSHYTRRHYRSAHYFWIFGLNCCSFHILVSAAFAKVRHISYWSIFWQPSLFWAFVNDLFLACPYPFQVIQKESSILDAINDVNQNSTFGCRNGFKFRVKQSMKWVCFYQLLCARLPTLLIPCSIIAFKGFIKVIEMYTQLCLLKMKP